VTEHFGAMIDAEVRIAAFDWLRHRVEEQGDVLPRTLLSQGFQFQGIRVPLLGPQGIFKPQILPNIPLSITTTPTGPYDDGFGKDGLLAYRYRGTNPNHRDNIGLREAMRSQNPLAYFHGITPGRYLVAWPVFVVGDDPEALTFKVAVDDVSLAERAAIAAFERPGSISEDSLARRAYITSAVRQRLHQRGFRERVLMAYREECALCHLRHRELLEAAHIVPDGEPGGEPIVQNGIALCTLHHAAFDRFIMGIRPDYVVQIKSTIMEEQNGPVLTHGLKGVHGMRITLPRYAAFKPYPKLLEWRWKRFKAAG